jgi:hypothetical protein
MSQRLAGVRDAHVGMAHVAVFDRRFEMRRRLCDMRILVAGVLGLRVHQRFARMMREAAGVACLAMGDGFLRMGDRLIEMVIGIADQGVNGVADGVFGVRDLRRREGDESSGKDKGQRATGHVRSPVKRMIAWLN